MNIYQKMYISFGFIIALIIMLASLSIYNLLEVSNLAKNHYKNPFRVSNAVKTLKSDILIIEKDIQLLIHITDQNKIILHIEKINKRERLIYKNYQLLYLKYLGKKSDIDISYGLFIGMKNIKDKLVYTVLNGNEDNIILDVQLLNHQASLLNTEMLMLEEFANNKSIKFFNDSNEYSEKTIIIILITIAIVLILIIVIGILSIKSLKTSQKKISNYFNILNNNVITFSTNLNGVFTEVSDKLLEVSQYKRYELLNTNVNLLRSSDTTAEVFDDLWNTIISNDIWNGEIKNQKKDGTFFYVEITISPVFDNNDIKVGYFAILNDISDKKVIEEISRTDPLTGLYNRRHFNELFENQLKIAKRSNSILVFAILDIDNFKEYNDIYGHQEGDYTLISVANSLSNTLCRPNDYIFRLGGEEFGILFYTNQQSDAISIMSTVKNNVELLEIEHTGNKAKSNFITISIGASIITTDNTNDKTEIYKKSDLALYEAKDSGRNSLYTVVL
jgi:diguanylate cyclase (GGDEF)-like protein/PAS domain S-box-containing protein